ncbi:hypothetical protein [Gemmatimonas sp.]|uniref:hypothetical protein n=1 Tax=Gemmatimonas sp. TaxID=1962908 RepID=UPI00356700C7
MLLRRGMTGGVVTAASLAQMQAPVGTNSYGLGASRRVVGGLNAHDPARDGSG